MTNEDDYINRRIRAVKLASDRKMTEYEIADGFYPQADRGLRFYLDCMPFLGMIVDQLMTKTEGPIYCLDLGCGTSRAAAEMCGRWPRLDMVGTTLKRHPPTDGPSLSPERIKIRHAGKLGFDPESFHLILAVGSLCTTDETFDTGVEVLDLLKPGGYLLLVDTTFFGAEPSEPTKQLIEYARERQFDVVGHVGIFSVNVNTFKKKS